MEELMDAYALKHAIREFRTQREQAEIKVRFDPKEEVKFGLQILLIERIEQLNKNLDELNTIERRNK